MNLPNNAPLEEIYLQNDFKSGVRLFLKKKIKYILLLVEISEENCIIT